MMWRAKVIEKIADGLVVVVIPKLYGTDPVGPMKSAVNADVGDTVVVTDLTPQAKVHDWWVLGYESEIGRWGSPYPHTHPMGQVDGLEAALAGKADVGESGGASSWNTLTDKPSTFPPSPHTHPQSDVTGLTALAADIAAATHLATPGAIPRRATNGGFRVVTGTNDQDAVNVDYVNLNFVTKTSYNAGMAAKSDAPTEWVNCTLMNGHTLDSGRTGPAPRARMTALGLQIHSKRLRGPNPASGRDTAILSIPSSLWPPYDITFSIAVQRSGTGNTGAAVTVKLKADSGELQYVSETVAITSQGTGPAAADYISLDNILLVW